MYDMTKRSCNVTAENKEFLNEGIYIGQVMELYEQLVALPTIKIYILHYFPNFSHNFVKGGMGL